ncbi:MAG: choice-of-anchor J domain-containing protein, partial [Thermoplasmata archaeon]
FPPLGWTRINVGGSYQWSRSTSYYHNGSASAYMSYQSGGDDWLITPRVSVVDGMYLSFWVRDIYSGTAELSVNLSTTGNQVNDFTVNLLTLSDTDITTTWTEYVIDLTPYAGQNVYIGFNFKNQNSISVYLDDVYIGTPRQNILVFEDTQVITTINVSQSHIVNFNPFHADNGTYIVNISTAVVDDVNPANDFINKTFKVITFSDYSVDLTSPNVSRVLNLDIYTFSILLRNTGIYAEPYTLNFILTHNETVTEVANVSTTGAIPPGGREVVNFTGIDLSQEVNQGNYTCTIEIIAPSDINPANNMMIYYFRVADIQDVVILNCNYPPASGDIPNLPFQFNITLTSRGNIHSYFNVSYQLFYENDDVTVIASEEVNISIDPFETLFIKFTQIQLPWEGNYTVKFLAYLPEDEKPSDNFLNRTFLVQNRSDMRVYSANFPPAIVTSEPVTLSASFENIGNINNTCEIGAIVKEIEFDDPVFYENFTTPDPGWTIQALNQNATWILGQESWLAANHSSYPSGGRGGVAYIDSDRIGSGRSQNDRLISPPIDLSGVLAPALMFDHYYYHYSNSQAYVEISTDNSSWTILKTYNASTSSWTTESIDISMYGGNTVWIAFRYVGSYAWYWLVDDVQIIPSSNSVTIYSNISNVSYLNPGQRVNVSFPQFVPENGKTYLLTYYINGTPDSNLSNNVVSSLFKCLDLVDIAVLSIVRPSTIINSGNLTPSVTITNNGNRNMTNISVRCVIVYNNGSGQPLYNESVLVPIINKTQSITLSFPQVLLTVEGFYLITFLCDLPIDVAPENNMMNRTFEVNDLIDFAILSISPNGTIQPVRQNITVTVRNNGDVNGTVAVDLTVQRVLSSETLVYDSFDDNTTTFFDFENRTANWNYTNISQNGSGALLCRYTNSSIEVLKSMPYSVPATDNISIYMQFYQIVSTESGYDFARIYIHDLDDNKIYTVQNYTESSNPAWSNPISNLSSAWRMFNISLDRFKGHTIVIEFNLRSDSSVVRQGWFIDEFKILGYILAGVPVIHETVSAYINKSQSLNVTFTNNGAGWLPRNGTIYVLTAEVNGSVFDENTTNNIMSVIVFVTGTGLVPVMEVSPTEISGLMIAGEKVTLNAVLNVSGELLNPTWTVNGEIVAQNISSYEFTKTTQMTDVVEAYLIYNDMLINYSWTIYLDPPPQVTSSPAPNTPDTPMVVQENLTIVVDGLETDIIGYDWEPKNIEGIVSIANRTTINPALIPAGIFNLTVTIRDGRNQATVLSWYLQIPDHPLVLINISGPDELEENTSGTFNLSYIDIDGVPSVEWYIDGVLVQGASGLSLQYVPGFDGEDRYVNISANATQGGVTQTVFKLVHVIDVKRGPVVNYSSLVPPLAAQLYTNESQIPGLSFSVEVVSGSGTTTTFSWFVNNVNQNISAPTFVFVPDYDTVNGTNRSANVTIMFVASNEFGSVNVSWNVTVNNTNRAPNFTMVSTINATVKKGTPIVFTIAPSDPDNDTLRMIITDTYMGTKKEIYNGSAFTFTVTDAETGDHLYNITVVDYWGEAFSRTTSVSVEEDKESGKSSGLLYAIIGLLLGLGILGAVILFFVFRRKKEPETVITETKEPAEVPEIEKKPEKAEEKKEEKPQENEVKERTEESAEPAKEKAAASAPAVEKTETAKKTEKKEEKTGKSVCAICKGKLKDDSKPVKCKCGKAFHPLCADREGECPACGKKL